MNFVGYGYSMSLRVFRYGAEWAPLRNNVRFDKEFVELGMCRCIEHKEKCEQASVPWSKVWPTML
jgi:hypothetical protein